MAKIAFLGAGMMGQPMARNFLDGGHSVTVYNRTLEKARPLEALGAKLAATPKEAAAGADLIMSSLTNDEASQQTWDGPDGALGLFAVLPPGEYEIRVSVGEPAPSKGR